MLRNIKSLRGFRLLGRDGEVGRVVDFYFDDVHWTVRYLVADTGVFLPGRKVLLSPMGIAAVDWEEEALRLTLTREQVRTSPEFDVAKPLTRQQEKAYHRHFKWPGYWGMGAGVWGPFGLPGLLAREPWNEPLETEEDRREEELERGRTDPHLRAVEEVFGYRLLATDDELGHVTDFIVDDESWTLRYLVTGTSRWFGKHVLVSTRWVEAVKWEERSVYVALTKDAIRTSPGWRPDVPITRAYEEALHEHYARPGYWTEAERIQKRPEQAELADEEGAPSRPYPTDHDTHPGMM